MLRSAAVTDFVRGGGGGVKLTPPPVRIGLNLPFTSLFFFYVHEINNDESIYLVTTVVSHPLIVLRMVFKEVNFDKSLSDMAVAQLFNLPLTTPIHIAWHQHSNRIPTQGKDKYHIRI